MMTAKQALALAHQHHVTIEVRGDRLRMTAPKAPPPEVVEAIGQAKPAIIDLLTRSKAPPEPERAAWDASDWRAYYDERAAIREYDGQRPRAEAERLAWGETVDAWRRTFWVPPPAWQCAGCGQPLSGAAAILNVGDGARVHDTQDFACLIAYGRRWRSLATAALAKMGLSPPAGGGEP